MVSDDSTSKSQHQVQSGFLLDVVVRQSSAVFQLFTCKDKSLLVWWDTLLILNLRLDVIDCVRGLHFQSDGLTGQGLHKDLHTTSQSKHQVESRLLLDVVIGKGSAVFQLLTGENQSLLVWWNALLVLDLALDVVNRVRRLNLKSNGLSGQSLDKDLHTSSQSQHQVESRLLLNVVVRQRSAIL